ncbi:MAG: hypothetical protein GY865_17575 [candidate division Zixibacteria bacterium]|nr:hypothetical protein [candidate division Zixibacteria bacterium]
MSDRNETGNTQTCIIWTQENSRLLIISAILISTAFALFYGWKLFWFLTDDAHIAFRYVSNSMLDYGYVWNQPPFRPVEGYTSFLWIVILDIIWRLFDVVPPESSNNISLIFSYLTLLLIAFSIMRLKLSQQLNRWRLLFLGLIILGTVTNTTFLTWTSSGLETALFNFCFTAWVVVGLFFNKRDNKWLICFSGATALIHLTRPDGILFIGATFVILFVFFMKWFLEGNLKIDKFLSISPLVVPFLHLAWRINTYGEWLPNTYYAKHVSPWPEAGLRYFTSFVLEYSLWIWIFSLIVVTVIYFKRVFKNKLAGNFDFTKSVSGQLINLFKNGNTGFSKIIILATIVFHFGYYTIVIGGDHFEWRVYSHLIPFVFVSFLWMLNILNLKPKMAISVFSIFLLFTYPISWKLWYLTKDINTREESYYLKMPLRGEFPSMLNWYTGTFDNLQFWLIDHSICMRRQEHKQFYLEQCRYFPTRSDGQQLNPGDYPVMNLPCVGVPAWVFPHMNILDMHGLNDYIIARSVPIVREERQMAHDRWPPDGYIDSFQPNYSMRKARALLFMERDHIFTEASIIRLEKYWELKMIQGIDLFDSTYKDSGSYYLNQGI